MVSQSSPRCSVRIWSPCSLKSGDLPGTDGSSSNCTGAAVNWNGVPDAVVIAAGPWVRELVPWLPVVLRRQVQVWLAIQSGSCYVRVASAYV